MKSPTRKAQSKRSAPPPATVPPRNPYEVLGVPPGVTEEQLKATYYRLAAQYHPDRNPGGAERMAEINIAYNALCNVALRAKVDAVYHTAPKKCPDCNGLGEKTWRSGFKAAKVRCPTCKGKKVVA